jgi:hypothetical protein
MLVIIQFHSKMHGLYNIKKLLLVFLDFPSVISAIVLL